MSVLEIENLRFSYGDNNLFNNANLRVFENEHIGIVGDNGSGKTTLMNLMAHRLIPDSGTIIWDKNVSFTYLDQQLEVNTNQTVVDYLYSVYLPLFKKEEEMNALYEKLVTVSENEYDKILNRAYAINEELENSGFYRIKSDISNVISGLGIDINNKRLLKETSLGERAKVFLGKMPLEKKDVLLLDEPTNFLDVNHIEWLSKYLNNYKHAYIIISHEFSFLNEVCDVIVSLENKVLTKYKGNFEKFLSQKELDKVTYLKQYEKQIKHIKHEEEFINKNIVRATTSKRAQSRRKALDKIVRLEKPSKEVSYKITFPFTKSFNLASIETNHLTIGYDKKIVLENLSFKFAFGKRYLIKGKNGVGKSTFIKTLLGIIPSLGGSFKVNDLNDILYFPQEEDVYDISPIDYVRLYYPYMDNMQVRTHLSKYGLFDKQMQEKCGMLSGGELQKLRLATISLKKSNLLILDEVTSHLDKAMKDALHDAIRDYPGTVIIISHEKSFFADLHMQEIIFR